MSETKLAFTSPASSLPMKSQFLQPTASRRSSVSVRRARARGKEGRRVLAWVTPVSQFSGAVGVRSRHPFSWNRRCPLAVAFHPAVTVGAASAGTASPEVNRSIGQS